MKFMMIGLKGNIVDDKRIRGTQLRFSHEGRSWKVLTVCRVDTRFESVVDFELDSGRCCCKSLSTVVPALTTGKGSPPHFL